MTREILMNKRTPIARILVGLAVGWSPLVYGADADNDLVDDAWEAHYGLSASDINDALLDTDNDGQIARDEFFADTDPTDNGSLMEVTGVAVSAAGAVTLTWTSAVKGIAPAPTYDVLVMDDALVAGGNWQTLQSGLAVAGAVTSANDDASAMATTLRLYRPVVNGHVQAGTINLGAVAKYTLAEGKSYIGVPLDPASVTLKDLLGTDQLPGGDTLANATTVEIWDQDTQSLTDRYWLSNVGGSEGWYEPDAVTSADNVVIDLSKGLIVTIRAGAGSQTLYVAGTIPRVPDSQTIKGSGYTLAALNYPMPLSLADSGMVEAGFQGHSGFSLLSDWVMLFDPATGLFDTKLWYETGTPAWRYVSSQEEAGDVAIAPNVPFLVRRVGASDLVWTNPVPTTPSISVSAFQPVAAEQEGTPGCFRITRSGSLEPLTIDFTISGNTNNLLPSASATDFTLLDGTLNNGVNGKVHIPFGVAYADVLVDPVNDAEDEPAEAITFTLDAPSGYVVGGQSQAVVKVGDRANTESNQVVYIAYLIPGGGVDSEAFGLATIRLRGDNDVAVLNLSFSGLTSPQSDVHIHRVDNGAIVEDIPLGQVSNYQWELEPFGGYTTELDVINALKNGDLYINVHSDNYPTGEITGVFNESIGTTELQIPPDPPAFTNLTASLQEQDIARFLNQATFGATTGLIAEVQSYIDVHGGGTNRIAGMSKWLDDQMNPAVVPQTFLDPHAEAAIELNDSYAFPFYYHQEEYYAWMNVARYGQDQVRQRVATALSEILVISVRNGGVDYYRNRAFTQYYDLLAGHAFGSYTNLLYDVSVSPQMGRYLSHLRNGKEVLNGMGEVVSSPDENYAREIMQLFSIGLTKQHLDGSLHIGANGLPQQTYTQDTIGEVAKVFTGWGFGVREDGAGGSVENTNFFLGNGGLGERIRFWAPMKMFQNYHDESAKVTLDGATIPAGQTGEKDLQDFIAILGNHPNIAPVISRKLIQRMVTSSPSAGYIYRVATVWTNSNGDLGEVTKAILLDHEARNMTSDGHVSFGKLKEPIVSYVSMLRALDASAVDITLDILTPYGFPASEMSKYPAGAGWLRINPAIGQKIMDSPTVFNFFLPEFTPPGALSAAGITAPEFELLTPVNLYDQINEAYLSVFTTRGGNQFLDMTGTHGFTNESDDLILNIQPLIDLFDAQGSDALGSEAVVDRLDLLLNGGRMKRLYDGVTPSPRSILIDLGANLDSASGTQTTEDKVENIIYCLLGSPDFAIQR